MLPLIGAPGTWVQLVNVGPDEDVLDRGRGDVSERVARVGDDADRVSGDLREHQATRVAGAGSREDAPIETRPLETSEMPTFEPPCRIRKPYFLPFLVLIHFLASWVSSGKTEVDPLIVMIFLRLRRGRYRREQRQGGDDRHEANSSS